MMQINKIGKYFLMCLVMWLPCKILQLYIIENLRRKIFPYLDSPVIKYSSPVRCRY